MSTYKIVIPGNTPSLKNSKQMVMTGDKPRLISSKTYRNWMPGALYQLNTSPLVGKKWSYPLRISFHFIRDSRRKFDFINAAQGPCDLLIQAGIIEDDDMLHLIPGEFSYQVGPKESACCILTITEVEA